MIKAGSCIRCIVAAGLSVITITAFGLQIVKADSRGATYAGDTKFVYDLDLRMNGATASIDAEDNCDMSLDGSVTYSLWKTDHYEYFSNETSDSTYLEESCDVPYIVYKSRCHYRVDSSSGGTDVTTWAEEYD